VRILVADDDKLFQAVMTDILGDAGHEVVLASNGEEALKKATSERLDLIILDVILPGLLGTEVCQKLRGYSRTASVPILLVSSGVTEIASVGGGPREFLADDFLQKPFLPEKLLERINQLTKDSSPFGELGRGRPPKPPPGKEERQSECPLIDVEISIQTADTLLYHPMLNLGTGGIFLDSEQPYRKGSNVELRFAIRGAENPVIAKGMVVRCQEIEIGQQWAVGVQFISISDHDLDTIRKFTCCMPQVLHPKGKAQIEVEGPAEKVVPIKIGDKKDK
jgi:DNA-binding response OmpR family regulator